MLDMRERWRVEGAVAFNRAAVPAFGRRREAMRGTDLTVDLADDALSLRWWRGVATLSALAMFITLIAPSPFEALPEISSEQVGPTEAEQLRDISLASIAEGSETGVRMAAGALVEPLSEAPDRPSIELFVRLGNGDSVAALLARAGAGYAEAGEAARLIRGAAGDDIAPGTSLAVQLGRKNSSGKRDIERISLRAGLDLDIVLTSAAGGMDVAVRRIAVDSTPVRVRGRVGDGLYWALRSSGVTAETAGEFLRALSSQIDVGAVGPDDQFDLILANRRAPSGESQAGPLLYAAIDRTGASDVRLMKWSVGGRTDWMEADGAGQRVAAMAWPVAGRITSGFGVRVHPILRFARMHRGIDFGAGYGAPIVAAADGQVAAAGWAGGYGRQVRIAHGGGIVTSYSHMSRTVAVPGSFVHQGQLIGYVGSSGLSTGPHLHYEVYRNGTPVNPLGVKFAEQALLAGPELARFKARLAQLMAIGS